MLGFALLYPTYINYWGVNSNRGGTLSPTLGYPISLAYVPTELASVGQQLEVEIRGKAYPAVVVKRPFYRSKNRLI